MVLLLSTKYLFVMRLQLRIERQQDEHRSRNESQADCEVAEGAHANTIRPMIEIAAHRQTKALAGSRSYFHLVSIAVSFGYWAWCRATFIATYNFRIKANRPSVSFKRGGY